MARMPFPLRDPVVVPPAGPCGTQQLCLTRPAMEMSRLIAVTRAIWERRQRAKNRSPSSSTGVARRTEGIAAPTTELVSPGDHQTPLKSEVPLLRGGGEGLGLTGADVARIKRPLGATSRVKVWAVPSSFLTVTVTPGL